MNSCILIYRENQFASSFPYIFSFPLSSMRSVECTQEKQWRISMNKRTLLIWLTVISMVTLTFPISQALAQGSTASSHSSQSKTSSGLSQLGHERATTNHTWRVVPSPNRSASYNQLDAVATVSANDVWAVGFYNNSNDAGLTLTEHWNGSRWSIVASPNLSPYANVLEAVAVVS